MRDLFIEISGSVKRNRLRTCLTGFAVAWGIFMLIVLLGAGNGLKNMTKANFGTINVNTMSVYGGRTQKAYAGFERGRRIRLEDKDADRTASDLFSEVIDEVSRTVNQSGVTLSYAKRYVSTTFEGVYPEVADMVKLQILAGRFISDLDNKELRKCIVIPASFAESLFNIKDGFDRVIGKRVKAGNASYRIVGVYKTDEMSLGGDTYVPYTTMRTIYRKGKNVDNIMFSFHGLETEAENDEFVRGYRAIMNSAHQVDPEDRGGVRVSNHYMQNMQMEKGMGIITKALWIVGLFTLLSGIVGVSNIMLITVKERTHEFGIRKAIGARPWDIVKLIISESVVITSVSGYLGMVLGMLACQYMKMTLGSSETVIMGQTVTLFKDPTVGLDVALEATIVLIVAGTIAGLIPAVKAAKVPPVEALRAD